MRPLSELNNLRPWALTFCAETSNQRNQLPFADERFRTEFHRTCEDTIENGRRVSRCTEVQRVLRLMGPGPDRYVGATGGIVYEQARSPPCEVCLFCSC